MFFAAAIATMMEVGAKAEVEKQQMFAARNGLLVPVGPGDVGH